MFTLNIKLIYLGLKCWSRERRSIWKRLWILVSCLPLGGGSSYWELFLQLEVGCRIKGNTLTHLHPQKQRWRRFGINIAPVLTSLKWWYQSSQSKSTGCLLDIYVFTLRGNQSPVYSVLFLNERTLGEYEQFPWPLPHSLSKPWESSSVMVGVFRMCS